MGAFVFAGQMINFTIPATGSSGHIGGGILLAAILGPYPALLAMAAVLLIQCLFFADGGLLALGCNLFNMGVIPCLLGYPLLYKAIAGRKLDGKHITAASIVAVVVSLQLGAFSVVLETTVSGVAQLPFGTFLALMQPIHLAIGLVEGVVTGAILGFVLKMRPEILESVSNGTKFSGKSVKKVVLVLLVLTLLVGGGVSLLKSSRPDGLEWAIGHVLGTTKIAQSGDVYSAAASVQSATAVMPGYRYSSGNSGTNGTSIAGIIGSAMSLVVVAASGLILSAVKKRKKRSAQK
jgi:cobalt/nickel transport system permease protein